MRDRFGGTYRPLAGAALAVGCLVAAALAARGQVDAAAAHFAAENGWPLCIAALCAPLVPAASAGAWRSVLASGENELTVAEAWGCYGLGSVANTFLPARGGDALRIELFSRRLPERNRRWRACGVAASVAIAQSAMFGCVLAVGALLGVLPIWTIVPALGVPCVTWAAGRIALRRQPGERVACLATAAVLSPLAWARVLAWTATASLARLLLAVAVLSALGVPSAFSVAIVALGGAAVGNSLPFAPGGAGVAAATMSLALGQAGVNTSMALAAAVTFHAFETAAGLLFGASGWLLMRLVERASRRGSMFAAVEPSVVTASR